MYKIIFIVSKGNLITGDDVCLSKIHVYILYYLMQGYEREELREKIPVSLGTLKSYIQELYLYTGLKRHNFGALGGWVGEHNMYYKIKEKAVKEWSLIDETG